MNVLSGALSEVNNWMNENRLKMNNDKTEYIIFGSRQKLEKVESKDININSVEIKGQKCIKYLGSLLDETLSFSNLISLKCKKAMFNIKRIPKIRKSIDKETANLIMVSLVITHLDYANGILIGITKSELTRLQKIQNIAAKKYVTKQERIVPRHV